MIRLSFAMVVSVAAFKLGTVAAVTESPNGRITRADPLLENWEKEEGLADLLSDMIASSKTSTPTATIEPSTIPTIKPSLSPTSFPTEFPSQQPSFTPTMSPSFSMHPTDQPSNTPTSSPSFAPSVSAPPSTSPSLQPTDFPSSAPSVSQQPSSTPSYHPSLSPSMSPSFAPTGMPSMDPSSPPSGNPTLSPSQSASPSQIPTKVTVLTSSIIIDKSKTKNATPLLIVGAACFVVMASTSAYLFRRGHETRKRNRASETTYDISSPHHGRKKIMLPYNDDDGLKPQHGIYMSNYSESESGVSDANTLEYCYDAKKRNNETLEDVETGRIGIDAIPNSVSIITRNKSNDENEVLGTPKVRMPKSIYVPKIFQRTKEANEGNIITWNRIREENRSPASSGFAPASVPSPMLSPFFVKGLTSILSPYKGTRKTGVLVNETCDDNEGVTSDATNEIFTYIHSPGNNSTKLSKRGRGEILSPNSDVFADIDNNGVHDHSRQKSPKTVVSKSSDGSSIEWGIDVSRAQTSTAALNESTTNQRNMSVFLDEVHGKKAPTTEEVVISSGMDVPMTYTDDSLDNCNHEDADLNSHGSAFLGDICIAPAELANSHSSRPNEILRMHKGSGITFERELLRANRRDCEGTFSFRNIFNDPKNDLYECHAPSGPLGIVVDTTPLGPRVRSLNPLSPIFGKLIPGDVIVGVDEVDTVGIEAGDFWQIVSRKANQQQRILTILRI